MKHPCYFFLNQNKKQIIIEKHNHLFLIDFQHKTFSQTEKKFTIEGIERKAIFLNLK
jgi:hypothetical protein